MTKVLIDGMDATDPQWALCRAGLIQVHLRYRLAASLATPGETSCGGLGSRKFDPAIHKNFGITEREKITVGVEAYNVLNHPNFGVPNNTQNPLVMGGNGGGNGDAVFKDAAGNFAANVGQILTTAGAARQIQLGGRFMF
jgi:hypothetical protein